MNRAILPSVKSLTVGVKSDRKRLRESELIEALVGLANTVASSGVARFIPKWK